MGTQKAVQARTIFSDRRGRRSIGKRRVSLREVGVTSIGICGVGLIGGSIAERLQSKHRSLKIYGHDRGKVLEFALNQHVIDCKARPAEMLRLCDLVILSANQVANQGILRQLARQKAHSSPLIIDTGSTQSGIAQLNRALHWNNEATFIAGHPMAGREVQGIESRLRNLFVEHPYFFDESVKLSSQHERILEWFSGALGSFTMYVANERHDAIMTDISQLPQLLSTVMSGFVSHYDRRTIHLAGTGLQSMIRLGGSPYSNWRDVFSENSRQLCDRLDALIKELTIVRARIKAGDSLQDNFQKARRSYSCLW